MPAIIRLRLLVLLTLLVVATAGCEKGTDDIAIPTRGPVSGFTSGLNTVYINVSSSTNCVEPGNTVDLTLTLENKTTNVITLTGQPVLEITIEPPSDSKLPNQYWSKSNDYPPTINPILKPSEKRIYHWIWKADNVYSPDLGVRNTVSASATIATYVTGSSAPIAMKSTVGFGVKFLKAGQVSVACQDMQ